MSDILKQSSNGLTAYILFFRKGNNIHTDWKHFSLAGDLRAAIDRGKKHCDLMNLRFLRVNPFLSDLAEEEKRNTQVDQ